MAVEIHQESRSVSRQVALGVRDKMVEVHPGPPGCHLSERSLEKKIIYFRSNFVMALGPILLLCNLSYYSNRLLENKHSLPSNLHRSILCNDL